jgi:hypothetical protein
MYNCTTLNQTSTSSGVLAYTSAYNSLFFNGTTPTTAHVTISISSAGLLTLKLGTTTIFNNVALPGAYLAANKSTWKHVISSRCGAVYESHAIDNLSIKYYSGGGMYEYSTDNTTWSATNPISVAPGTYPVSIRIAGNPSCSALLGNAVVNTPSYTTTSTSPSVCTLNSSSVSLGFTPAFAGATYQWESSPAGANTWTQIFGAVNETYSPPAGSITVNTDFRCNIYCSGVPVTGSPTVPVTITVVTPAITGITPATRCGVGTVTLGATGTGGTLTWYNAPLGGTAIGTGSTLVTPIINATTSYYVASQTGGTPVDAIVGTGATTSATYSNPFYSLYSNIHTQHLILASELNAAGVSSGELTSVSLNITSAGTLPMIDFVLKVGSTSTTSLTSFVGGVTQVYSSASLMPTTGWNTITFTTPYYWDGVSNLVLDFCHGNSASSATMSRTATADNTSFNSSIKTHVSAATAGSTICPDVATNLVTYTVRPQFTFHVNPGCNSARTEVVATVTTPPALTLTANQTICNNSIATIGVTSTLTDFDSYIWSPVTDLYTDAACTVPYTGTTANTVYFKSTTGGSPVFTCTATNLTTECSNVATTTITNMPGTFTLTADKSDLCITGVAELTPSQLTGWGTATFQWQDSPDGVTYTDIINAVNMNYTTPTLTQTRYYRLQVFVNSVLCTYGDKTIVVNNPVVSATTNDTICGAGTATLTVSGSGGTFNWYGSATSGTILGTGSTFTSPVISATKTYYVECAGGGGATGYVGANDLSIGTSSTYGDVSYYLYFDVLADATIKSVDIFPAVAPGASFSIVLCNSSGTILQTYSGVTTVASGSRETVPVNFAVTPGTNYRIRFNSVPSGSSIWRNTTGATYPYTIPGVISINGNSFSGYPQYYYYFYNWKVSTGCTSGRVPAVALVNPAPAISATSNTPICTGQTSALGVTSGNTNYTYVWTPGNLSGATQTVTPTANTTYTVTANDATTNCANTASVNVVVNPNPAVVTVSPDNGVTDVITQLTASGGGVASIIPMDQNFNSGATSNYTTGKSAPVAAPSSGSGTTNFGLVFDVTSAFTLNSVTVYPVSATSASGTVTIDIVNGSGTVIHTATANVTGSPSGTPVAHVIPLNFNVAPGTNYKMKPSFTGISGLLFDPSGNGNYAYPFTIPGVLSINHSTLTAAPTNTARLDLYYYFYNWSVTTGTGWTVSSGASSPSACNWYYQDSPYTYSSYQNNFSTTDGGKFMISNADIGGSGVTTDTRLVSPVFSTVGMSVANLSFETAYQYWASGDQTVALEISTDGGTNWSVLKNYMGTNYGSNSATVAENISLNSYLNMSNLRLRFNYITTYGYYWIIDKVVISGGAPAQCTWAPTAGLYTDASATTPYTGGNASVVYANTTTPVIYTATATNAYGCTSSATAEFVSNTKTLNLKAYIQGLYNAGLGMMTETNDDTFAPKFGAGIADTVCVQLHNDIDFSVVEARYPGIELQTNGDIVINTVDGSLGGDYYITIFPRNAIPVTTSSPVSFAGSVINYDFTTAATQAYGNDAQALVDAGKYAMYSGELDHDMFYFVDLSDLPFEEVDVELGSLGYIITDIDGNGWVDLTDLAFIEANLVLGPYFQNPLFKKHPVSNH